MKMNLLFIIGCIEPRIAKNSSKDRWSIGRDTVLDT